MQLFLITIIGFTLIMFSLLINTPPNLTSKIIFKVTPFFSGLFLLWSGLTKMGVYFA